MTDAETHYSQWQASLSLTHEWSTVLISVVLALSGGVFVLFRNRGTRENHEGVSAKCSRKRNTETRHRHLVSATAEVAPKVPPQFEDGQTTDGDGDSDGDGDGYTHVRSEILRRMYSADNITAAEHSLALFAIERCAAAEPNDLSLFSAMVETLTDIAIDNDRNELLVEFAETIEPSRLSLFAEVVDRRRRPAMPLFRDVTSLFGVVNRQDCSAQWLDAIEMLQELWDGWSLKTTEGRNNKINFCHVALKSDGLTALQRMMASDDVQLQQSATRLMGDVVPLIWS